MLLFLVPEGFLGASQVALAAKEPTCQAGDVRKSGLTPGLGRSPAVGDGHALQDSCLESPMDRGAWRATVLGVTESRTRLSDLAQHGKAFLPNSSLQNT